jgi:DNA polymerase beta
VSGKTLVRTRGRQHLPFLQVISSVAQCRASPLLQDVVRSLQAAGLLAATLTSTPYKWRGIALLPLRASANDDFNTNGHLGGEWQEVGDRMRDIRAMRGKYVRLDLR